MVVHTVPLRVNAAGDGYAPSLAPTKPMSTVLPPLAASVPSQLRLVTVTAWPFSVQLPFQSELIDSEAAGKEKASVQPSIGSGPALVMLMLATNPLPQPWVTA